MSGASASAAHMVPARAARRLFSDQTLIGPTSLRRPPATAKRAGQPGHLRSAEGRLQQLKRVHSRGQTLSGGLRFQHTFSWQSLSQSSPGRNSLNAARILLVVYTRQHLASRNRRAERLQKPSRTWDSWKATSGQVALARRHRASGRHQRHMSIQRCNSSDSFTAIPS